MIDKKPEHGAVDAQAPCDDPPGKTDVEAGDHQGSPQPLYPPTRVVVPILLGIYAGIFLVALDRTIVGVAIPRITDEFHSLGDVGWYGSAYMLTACSIQLVIGKLYTFYNPKWVYLINLLLFTIGSAVCGAAPNSIAFILGRAIAGLGSAGMFTGGVLLAIPLMPLQKRALIQGLAGSIFGIASVTGPLIGGAFASSSATWRWCFYLNLPIGAVTAVLILFVLKNTPPPRNAGLTLKEKLIQLDPLGQFLFMPSIICLILALQWGGNDYAWNDWRIIFLFCVFGVLILAFIGLQLRNKNDTATIAPRIISNRTVAGTLWFTFCNSSCMFVFVYYLPIWFQAIKGASAVHSGIMNLPLVLSLVVASILTGITVSKMGYYTPFLIASSVIVSIGAGMLTTFRTNTGHPAWIGYQVLLGFGLGLGMQQSNIAIQTVLSRIDVPMGTTLLFFSQQLGGAVFVAVGQSIFTNDLIRGVSGLTDLNPRSITAIGATELQQRVPADVLPQVLAAYNDALVQAFQVGLAMACLSILGSAAVEWRSVKSANSDLKGPAPVGDAPAPLPGVVDVKEKLPLDAQTGGNSPSADEKAVEKVDPDATREGSRVDGHAEEEGAPALSSAAKEKDLEAQGASRAASGAEVVGEKN
ncbi:major facilitator superfamily domain-containing protein [Phyllosticta citrichinensis]|uniref:Major facilitator superfamily domain-containing protein n=1 Tax=Phyllosticta citrichinensis TaxID=1130410 RepID=A0ABR1Y7W8_9PEZI